MKYTVEKNLRNFDFWGGAAENANQLTDAELDTLEDLLPDILGENVTDTDINDLFWFDFETVLELLGYNIDDAGDIVRDEEEEEEEE